MDFSSGNILNCFIIKSWRKTSCKILIWENMPCILFLSYAYDQTCSPSSPKTQNQCLYLENNNPVSATSIWGFFFSAHAFPLGWQNLSLKKQGCKPEPPSSPAKGLSPAHTEPRNDKYSYSCLNLHFWMWKTRQN